MQRKGLGTLKGREVTRVRSEKVIWEKKGRSLKKGRRNGGKYRRKEDREEEGILAW
jgi:hypothetical protein